MWSPETRNKTLTLAIAIATTVAVFQTVNLLVQWRAKQQYQRLARPHASLLDYRTGPARNTQWVALLGTVFDVSGDSFFDQRAQGVYATWLHQDVTALLVYGGVIDGDSSVLGTAELFRTEIELTDVQAAMADDASTRRRQILDEWYKRFMTRYPAVCQLSDLYAGDGWDMLRQTLTPSAHSTRRRGKCPLGFGSPAVEEKVVEASTDSTEPPQEIFFLGRRYDVTGCDWFEAPDGVFAAFVGHDITYALATQGGVDAMDVECARPFTYEEQVRLEQYRRLFASKLRVIVGSAQAQSEESETNVHRLIDTDASIEEIRDALATDLARVNAVCERTTMTPLHKAVERNRLELVELLLSVGAHPQAGAPLYDDETAMDMATRFGYKEIIDALRSS